MISILLSLYTSYRMPSTWEDLFQSTVLEEELKDLKGELVTGEEWIEELESDDRLGEDEDWVAHFFCSPSQ